jgi:hypothetical protein
VKGPPTYPEKAGNPAEGCNHKGLTRQISRQEPGRIQHGTRQKGKCSSGPPCIREGILILNYGRHGEHGGEAEPDVLHKITKGTKKIGGLEVEIF